MSPRPPFPGYLMRALDGAAPSLIKKLEGDFAQLLPTRDAVNEIIDYLNKLGGGGGFVAVENVAALEALDASTLADGTEVFVKSVRRNFKLRPFRLFGKALNPPYNCNANVPDRDKSWQSYPTPELWLTKSEEDAWWLDTVNGDDEGSGDQASPLKSFAEFHRRTYMPGGAAPYVVLNIVEDVLSDLQTYSYSRSLYVNGTVKIVQAPVAATAVVQAKKTATCNRQSVTSAVLPMDPSHLLQQMNGPNVVSLGWAVGAKNELNVTFTRIYDGSESGLTIVTPLNARPFREVSLPQFNMDLMMEANTTLSMDSVTFGGTVQDGSIYAHVCVFGSVNEGTYPTLRNCNGIIELCNIVNQLQLTEGSSIIFGNMTVQADALTSASGDLIINPNCYAQVQGDSGVVGDDVVLRVSGGEILFAGDLEISGGGTVSGFTAGVNLAFQNEYVWGADGATVSLRRTRSAIVFSALTEWTSDGSYSHPDGAGGTTTAPLGNLPLAPSIASMPNYNVGVIPDR